MIRKGSTAISIVALVGVLAVGCSGNSDSKDKEKSAVSTTASKTDTTAGTKTTEAKDGSESSSDTTASLKELSNSNIKAILSEQEPELWALVNYDYLSWNAFGGYNVILNEGADASKAVALCEAFSAIVYESDEFKPQPDASIVIATPTSATDVTGTPVVKRENAEGTCATV